MNRAEAKYILCAYHLGGQDADDPQFRDALEMVKHDPALAGWFAQEQAADTRLSEKFQDFPVPSNLQAQLLAARKVIPLRAWWQRPVWIVAAAACAIVVATCAALLLGRPEESQFAAFRSYVADTTRKLDHLDLRSKDVAEVRRWLQQRSAPGSFTLPANLSGRPSIGCRIFDWNGETVSLVCFELEGGQAVHLFVMDRHGVRGAPNATTPQFAVKNGIATAAWTSDQCVFVLASNAGEPTLRQLL